MSTATPAPVPESVANEATQPTRRHHGKTLVFCCKRCLPHFDKNPDLFADQE